MSTRSTVHRVARAIARRTAPARPPTSPIVKDAALTDIASTTSAASTGVAAATIDLVAAPPVVEEPSPRDDVRALQQLINAATAQRLEVDGIFGPKTKGAVQFLQRRLELPPTGEADAMTLALAVQRIEDSRRRRAAPRRFLLALPVPPAAGARPRRRQLLVDVPTQMFIGRELDENGLAGYEPETLAVFLAALARRPQGTVLDVGANIGVFSMLAAALSDWEVVAFEPTPELAVAARRVAEANSLRFTVEEVALGRESGSATFYLSDVTDASNSLAAGFRPSTRSLLVPVETLDDWSARTGIVPDVIKIDTETTEPDVLHGARGLLREHRPWLLCEVLPGHREEDLLAELVPLGYTWHHIRDGEPLEATTELDATDPNRNWLFTPEPLDAAFLGEVDAWRRALAGLDERIP
jgi:FkbM family methyltransferase